MRYKNNIGPQVRRRRYALGWSQSISPQNCRSPASTSAEAAFLKSKRAFRTWTTKRLSISRRF